MRTLSGLGAAVLLAAAAGAFAATEIEITVTAEKEQLVTTDAGEQELRRVEAERAVPGDEVIYTIRYANTSDAPAENVKITNPIPEHMQLTRLDPADSRTQVTFSVDGGTHYDAAEKLLVVDALGNERTAEPSEYTHVRWTILHPLRPGDAGTVGFRAELQ